MTVDTTFLPKTNGLVFGDRLVARSNKGRVFMMANESITYPPLVNVTPPTISGTAETFATITGTKAVYSGGQPPVAVQSQIQVSDNGTSGWSGVDAWGTDDAGTHYISESQYGKFFRVAGRAIDESIDSVSQAETLMSFSDVLGPVVYADPSVTITQALQPIYDISPGSRVTISCGGRGLYDLTYTWQMRKADNSGWVTATVAQLENEYPDANPLVFEPSRQSEPNMSSFQISLVSGPGPTQFRCRVRDTDPLGVNAQKVLTTTLNYV